MSNTKIVVAFHKQYPLHEFIQNKDIYIPIYHGNDPSINMIRDDTGRNIAGLNPYINQITQLFWFYNHLDQFNNPQYIGLNGYRRFLYFEQKDLNKNTIIATKINLTPYDQDIVKHLLIHKEMQPIEIDKITNFYLCACPEEGKYLKDFLYQGDFYFGNLFIMPKEFLDQYMKIINFFIRELTWFLKYDKTLFEKHQRVFGMFLERITSYFIWKKENINGVKVIDNPVIVPESQKEYFETFVVGNFCTYKNEIITKVKNKQYSSSSERITYPNRIQTT